MKKLYRKGTVHPSPPVVSDHLSFLPAAIFTLTVALSQQDKEVLAYLISCSSGSGNFSGDFSGNRRNTHKSTSPNSAVGTSSGGAKISAAAHGGVHGGAGGGDGGFESFSGEYFGKNKTTQKSFIPNSAFATSTGGADRFSGEFPVDLAGKSRTAQKSSTTPNSAHSGGATVVNGCVDHLPTFNCYCFACYMSYWVKWDSSPNRQLIHEILDAYEDGLQSKKEKSKKEKRNKKKGSNNSSDSLELKKSTSESTLKKNGPGSGSGTGSGYFDQVEEVSGNRDGGGEEDEGGDEDGNEKGSMRRFVSFLGEKIWGVWT